jgi:hypothetical protein
VARRLPPGIFRQAGGGRIEAVRSLGILQLVHERMAHLNPLAAKWELYELEDRGEEIRQLDFLDRGNVVTRLMRCCDESDIHARFEEPIGWCGL